MYMGPSELTSESKPLTEWFTIVALTLWISYCDIDLGFCQIIGYRCRRRSCGNGGSQLVLAQVLGMLRNNFEEGWRLDAVVLLTST